MNDGFGKRKTGQKINQNPDIRNPETGYQNMKARTILAGQENKEIWTMRTKGLCEFKNDLFKYVWPNLPLLCMVGLLWKISSFGKEAGSWYNEPRVFPQGWGGGWRSFFLSAGKTKGFLFPLGEISTLF
jgi:hypothetical protein